METEDGIQEIIEQNKIKKTLSKINFLLWNFLGEGRLFADYFPGQRTLTKVFWTEITEGLQRSHRHGRRRNRTPDFAVNLKILRLTEGGKYEWWKIGRRSTGFKATQNWFTFFWRREKRWELLGKIYNEKRSSSKNSNFHNSKKNWERKFSITRSDRQQVELMNNQNLCITCDAFRGCGGELDSNYYLSISRPSFFEVIPLH